MYVRDVCIIETFWEDDGLYYRLMSWDPGRLDHCHLGWMSFSPISDSE